DIRYDLANCQRFYQTGNTQLYLSAPTATAIISQAAYFPVSMRAVPSVSVAPSSGPNTGTLSINTQGNSGVLVYGAATAAGQVNVPISFTASADL
ncbi:MAG: hypothetical protein WAK55_05915, partial [Xanthobacteraceae bacterium]